MHFVVVPMSSEKSLRVWQRKTKEERQKLHNKKNKYASQGATSLTKLFLSNKQNITSSVNSAPNNPAQVAGTNPPDNEVT